jgi:hypothetical protein
MVPGLAEIVRTHGVPRRRAAERAVQRDNARPPLFNWIHGI